MNRTSTLMILSSVYVRIVILLIPFCVLAGKPHDCIAQGSNIIYGSDAVDKHFLVGTLGYTSTAVKEKLKVEVFGGAWHNYDLGEAIFYVSTRDGIKINREIHGGSTSRYELKIFDNGSSYDFVIRLTIGYPAIQVKSWILQGGTSYGQTFETEFNVISYDPAGKTDITSQVTINDIFITNNVGNVGIGTTTPDYKLDVLGTIRANEVKVATGWSDFVFEPDYDLKSLDQVENFISENGHLPDIPSAEEVEENGISLGEMDAKLLQKIEELTLYVIEQQKIIQSQNERIKKLEKFIQ